MEGCFPFSSCCHRQWPLPHTSLSLLWAVRDWTGHPENEAALHSSLWLFSLCSCCLLVPDASQGTWQWLSLPLPLAIEISQWLPESITPRVMTSVWLGSSWCCRSWAWTLILWCSMSFSTCSNAFQQSLSFLVVELYFRDKPKYKAWIQNT